VDLRKIGAVGFGNEGGLLADFLEIAENFLKRGRLSVGSQDGGDE
jgi:hypothetical protein